MTRVFIVAASPLARAGLENLLAAREFEVVGSVATMDALSDVLADATQVGEGLGSGEVARIDGPHGRISWTLARRDAIGGLERKIVIVAIHHLNDMLQIGYLVDAV